MREGKESGCKLRILSYPLRASWNVGQVDEYKTVCFLGTTRGLPDEHSTLICLCCLHVCAEVKRHQREYGLSNGRSPWLKGHSSANDRFQLLSRLESLPMVLDTYYPDTHSAAEISLNCMKCPNVQTSYIMLSSKRFQGMGDILKNFISVNQPCSHKQMTCKALPL